MRNITRNNYTPHIGDYHNMIVHDEVLGKVWLFDCDGVFLDMSKTNVAVVDDYGESTEYAASQRLVTATKDNLTEEIGEVDEASQSRDDALDERIDDEVDTLEQEIASVESESIARDNALEADYTQKYNTLDNDIETLTRTTDNLATDIEDINRTAVFGVTLNQNDTAKITMTVVDGGATTNTDIRNASSTKSGLMTSADYNQIRQNTSDIAAETAARQAADNNLQSEIDAIVASSDVKDIVGTKADLNNYDTSTLGDNDIIKVLQDESQNDETTYYRWSTSTSSFSLIGAEGPYYTKSATDTLLNAKADKATTYTKTEVDTALNGKVDKTSVVQTLGQSTTDIMSQKAVTDTIYSPWGGGISIKECPGWDDTIGFIALGKGINVSDNYGEIAIGNFSQAYGWNGSVALGYRAKNGYEGISLGAYSVGSSITSIDGDYGTLSVGRKTSETYVNEFGNTVTIPAFTRRIVNVKDPVDDSDAATKHYVESRNRLYCNYIPTSAGDEIALYHDEAMTSLVSLSEFNNLLYSGTPITITDASSGSTVITYDGNGDAWWGLTGSILVEVTSTSTAGKTMRIGRYKDLNGDVLTTLSYGSSTWNDFITAYRKNGIVYCRASSSADPSSGSQTRMAFMAYVSNPTNPTSVEFQYVRSVNNKSASSQVDQVFVYKLTNANGGTWTVETRDMASTVAAGTNAESTYSGTTITINPRLYTTTGQNTNGGITQKLFTDTVGNIQAALNAINNGGNA